ncbi:protoporphyrinogen/coproporphyrinogen oxidase [Pandoraea sputorum]|uniref:protoporphyrinogen/coproporphyrinogen oxidase n=1 Tax=Pandoraea sputorum TaxID=93222 RepID=UPI002B317DEE|nr:NAD(P)/FAD-dependent oxidoreductase [Pandoraea sputorum]
MKHIPIAILGGGIAGLGAALRAKELGLNATVFEAGNSAGGLLDNFVVDGFRFDNAVHLSFATEPEVRRIFDRTPYLTHPADSMCFDNGVWLKHPVQNNLFPLSASRKVELIKSFLARPKDVDPTNYEQWLLSQYGDEIARSYPIAYTHKYWGTPPDQLSVNWIGNRMRRAELDEILFGAFTAQTPNTYYTKEMRYPKEGGYKAFIAPLIQDARIELNSRVIKIDPTLKQIEFDGGTTVSYDRLVSTLPLPELVRMMTEVPAAVANAAAKLEATSIDLISVGFKVELDLDLWFYIYDEDIYASRAYSPSVKSPANVPAGCSSLQFEVYQRGRDARYSAQELKDNVRMAIEKMGIAKADDVQFLHHKRLPWGNVIFDIGMEENRQIVRDHLDARKVASCGRFGEWDYLWSNQSFLSGYRAI